MAIEEIAQPTAVEVRFRKLAQEWKAERAPTSSVEKLAIHPAYQQIIDLGPDVLPAIFRELERAPDHWFWALRALTGENPVAPDHRGNLRSMADDWVEWAKQQGYEW